VRLSEASPDGKILSVKISHYIAFSDEVGFYYRRRAPTATPAFLFFKILLNCLLASRLVAIPHPSLGFLDGPYAFDDSKISSPHPPGLLLEFFSFPLDMFPPVFDPKP